MKYMVINRLICPEIISSGVFDIHLYCPVIRYLFVYALYVHNFVMVCGSIAVIGLKEWLTSLIYQWNKNMMKRKITTENNKSIYMRKWSFHFYKMFANSTEKSIYFPGWYMVFNQSTLTHWGRDRMAAISQTTFSIAFSWMKMYEFQLSFHWSLFLRVQLTIFKHWFR